MMPDCPLCQATMVSDFCQDQHRRYFECSRCRLIFADPASRPSAEEEKARYDRHQNHPGDLGYRQFLGRLVEPLVAHLGPGAWEGLDFGCGPGPTLSVMLEERGYAMSLYDPFYAPDPAVLSRSYDFVTCTEAMEHFHTPGREWPLLVRLVKPGGWLAIMTRLATDVRAFGQWDYANDFTHVSFFRRETFNYLSDRDGLEVEFVGNDGILLRKPW